MFGTDDIEIKLLEPYKNRYKIRGNLRTIKNYKDTSGCKEFLNTLIKDLLAMLIPMIIIMGSIYLIIYLVSVFV